MAAGVLSRAGYFMGDFLYDGDEGNPKGYFEDQEINQINDEILSQIVPKRPSGWLGDFFYRNRIPHMQRWLARVPITTHMHLSVSLKERIEKASSRQPFCYKDPRFC
ncbi:MAG: hypothetical protein ACE5HX_19075, partial [bacterium]